VAVLLLIQVHSNKGSILGDKTHGRTCKRRKCIYPSFPEFRISGRSGEYNFETMMICEAAGYDYILIETVGVGQSEVLVADITDVFILKNYWRRR
jgi:LAO/AO transport system kinase